MKLDQLQEAAYTGQRSMKQMLQFFFQDDELTDGNEDESIFFPGRDYIVRNNDAHGEANEVWWIKLDRTQPGKVGVMYTDEMHDWYSEKEFVTSFFVYEQKLIY